MLDLARQSIERLAANGYSDPNEPALALRPEKLIGETGMLLYAAAGVRGHAELNARVESVARLLVPHARSTRILLEICLEPSLALEFAEAHICLSKLGDPDRGFDELLRQSLSSQAGTGRERVPYRALEQHWIRGIWTEATLEGGAPSALPVLDSVLKRPLDLLGAGRNEAYAFTHALMYLRDFNIRPRRLPRARALILAEAEAALARCLDEENYDLGGEMLMAWPLTGAPWSAGAAFAFRVLARAEDKNGVLPAPGPPPQPAKELQGDARTDYLLATSYHTAYVMGLLCCAALHPGRAPPMKLAASSAPNKDAAGAVLRMLDADGRRPHWRHELDDISPREREALAGFLLSIALCRKIRSRAFAEAHEILRVGYALGLANGPAASQAAEMLERLATFDRISGQLPDARSRGHLDAPAQASGF